MIRDPQKSIPLAAKPPTRERGEARVAALMRAGAAVFSEKGFEAATMTEIASRAGASIGSLYQFFPKKETLAQALLQRFAERVGAALLAIKANAASMNPDQIADALIGFILSFKDERASALALWETSRDLSAQRRVVSKITADGLIGILRARRPGLRPERAAIIADAVTQILRGAPKGGDEVPRRVLDARVVELRAVLRLYLLERLSPRRSADK